ncbi:DNA replication factor GINS [Halarchaeum rubridurum]|uniref:DNA replication factor GINS n=1 Tax=Halarchaeum rubridurum TaxID=489911 RepID=A0A830FXF0_9EURY|nr:hypothetical protein [Halarchaeum rubridurum]MBP1953668.1 DNA replication factor GINS [Halarchaeum rubridurum]GGM53724.1 hypothetical protein GCM10009017_00100 [Halarchaeum rubridurum]
MNIDDLRAAQSRERTTDGLQDLRDSFYREAAEYIADLRERRERAAAEADDPFGDDEVQSLTDEIETAEQVAEAIYERRVGKIVKQASLAAAGMGSDAEGLTAEERDLYTDLVARIESNKSRVLDVLAGEADAATSAGPDAHAPPESDESPDPADVVNDRAAGGADGARVPAGADAPTPPPDEPAPDEPAPDERETETGGDAAADPSTSTAAAAMGGDGGPLDDGTGSSGEDDAESSAGSDAESGGGDGGESGADGGANADAGDADPDVERSTVHIKTDVGEVYGIDERAYTLEADDVVTLPTENAEPLLARDAAEELD